MGRKLLPVIYYLFVSVVLSSLGACSRPKTAPVRKAEEAITLKRRTLTRGVDLFLLIDESGSMYGEKGTDPQGLRYEAGKYLVQNLLVKEADPTFPHRIALVHFGDKAISHPFVDLLPANATELAKRIPHTGKHLGDTSFIEALRAVREVAESTPSSQNKRDRIVVIFTDGEPDDKRHLALKEYFQELKRFRQEHLQEVKFYVIGIDKTLDHVRWLRSQRLWEEEIGKDNVFFIIEMKELYAKYNEVVRRIFELPEVSPDVVTEEVAFEVQPYLDRLEFHIFPESRELKLGISRPDQTPAQVEDKDVSLQKGEGYDILTLREPQPGSWKYKILEGKGRILVLRNPVPFRLTLVEPEDVHPLGKPLLLKARFIKGEGEEIAEHPYYPLAFAAKVITPKREETNVQFLESRKIGGVYYADKVILAQEPGRYVIKLTVKGGSKFETTATREVFVHSYPYLDVSEPAALQSHPLSDHLAVEVTLKRDDAPTDPEKEFDNHPNALILAQLKDSPDHTESPTIWLTQEGGKGIFRGVIPCSLRQIGRYSLAFQLAGTPRVSDTLRPPVVIETIDFLVQPSTSQKALRWGLYTLAAILIGGVMWGTSFTVWLFRLPTVTANIEVREGDNVTFTKYVNAGYVKPTPIPGEADGILRIWLRARDADSLYITQGGLLSFFTFGFFHRCILVTRNEETDLDTTRRISFS